jgi:hypothetical protein
VGVAVCVVAAAIGAGFAHGAPTGRPFVDACYRILFAATVTVLAVRSRRWAVIVAGLLGALICGFPALLFGLVSLTITAVTAGWQKRARIPAAAAGALAAQGLLRGERPGGFALTALIAGVALLLLAGSAYRTARRREQRLVRRLALGAAVVLVLAAAGALFGVLAEKSALENSLRRANAGIEASQAGHAEEAKATLSAVRAELVSAVSGLNALWTEPGSFLPIVSQHLHAVRTLAADGRDMTTSAFDVASAVDLNALRHNDGSIDLQRLREFAAPLERSAGALAQTRSHARAVDSPWLLPFISHRIQDVSNRLTRIEPGLSLTARAAQFLPTLLGANGERHYFMMLVTPAESRELGGHMGNWAELRAADGRISVVRRGRAADLLPAGVVGRELHDAESYPPAFSAYRPQIWPQNWSGTPDFETAARAVADLYPQSGGDKIDGVIMADPAGFAGLLSLSGPVSVPGGPTLDESTAAEFLLRQQYSAIPDEAQRSEFLNSLVTTTFERLKTGGSGSPRQVVEHLAPLVRGHHLRFTTFDPAEREFLTAAGLNSTLRAPAQGDLLALLSTNIGPNKMDAYVQRNMEVNLSVATNGDVSSEVTATLKNAGPATGPEDVVGNNAQLPTGTAITRLAILTMLDLLEAHEGDQLAPVSPQLEFGLNRFTVRTDVPAGGSRTTKFSLAGHLKEPDRSYRLRIAAQPVATPDHVMLEAGAGAKGRIEVRMPGQATISGTDRVEFDLVADAEVTFLRR